MIVYFFVFYMVFFVVGLFRCIEIGLVGVFIMFVRYGFILFGLFVFCVINLELVYFCKLKIIRGVIWFILMFNWLWFGIIIVNLGVFFCFVIIREILLFVVVVVVYFWFFVVFVVYFMVSGVYSFFMYC